LKKNNKLSEAFSIFGYFSVIFVSFVVGLWNYIVALAVVFTESGFLAALGSLESLFVSVSK
jgi:hypothetical protein